MSIIPEVSEAYELDSEEEFRVRYYVSRIGFEEIWSGRPRETKEQIESFYQEHDKDIWRQAYLSKHGYMYKRKILEAYHIARTHVGKRLYESRVLDHGGGAGVLTHYLVSKGYQVDIADIPSQTLTFVREHLAGYRRAIALDGKERFEEEHYILIFSLDVLEHTVDPLRITHNLLRALKRGGMLVVGFPIEDDFSLPHTRQAQEERTKVFRLLEQTCDVVVPERMYRKR